MRLLFNNDWLRSKISGDPDIETEAGRVMSIKTQGVRVMPNENGWLPHEIAEPARYGKVTSDALKVHSPIGWWQVTTPDGSMVSLNPAIHTVIEHDDGTITVSPSIDLSKRQTGGWHGWLERGVFRSC